MPYPDIDLDLTDEQKASRDMVRQFGAEVMRPAGIALDKLSDPAEVIADGSILWDVFRKFRELGLHATSFSKSIGGTAEDMDPMTGILVLDEMGYADAGLAISLGVSSMPFTFCQFLPVPALQDLARQYVEDKDCRLIGCWGITEPDHGADWGLGGDKPECGPSLRGVLKGDEYIINGQKSAWVSNGTIATHSVLHVGLDPSRGMQGQGIAICPLDLPGITRGKPLDKIGQRPLNQGEIFFDDVQLPKEYMIVTPRPASEAGGGLFSGGGTPMGSMAVMFGGLARAALDEAITYARDRVQGGVPIIEHKNIKLKLFEMFMMTESARSLARRLQLYNSKSGSSSMVHTMAGKWMSTETAFKVSSEAIQIFGGNGLTKQYVIEKIFRDARAAMIEDGTNEALALSVVDGL